ncbi:transient receptor potential cation channel subfamily V iav isoform X2 [Arctopsyche grandis]
MYAEGKGQIINRAEYLRWKFRDQKHVVLPIEASLSRHDPLSKWRDHAACWQMRHRGALGESLLHVLIICDTRLHTRLARTLLKCFPRLALDVVEGEEYLGASSLHLAIAYSNNELVQDLVEAGANVSQRAIGSFFLPRDQQRFNPARHTDYEGLAYLGEYPLAWAACCANESVYNLLLDSGADPDLQDSFGNMILHMVVVCDKLDMFGYALRHPKLPASNGKMNNDGLTPLTLACKLGRAEVFKEMLELSAREFWRYSNITCSAYPLNALDTLLPDGRTNWNSALFIILNGTKEAHLDMLDGGIIQKLLEEKWKTFARNQFLKRLLILFIHLVFLSLAVYLRPLERSVSLLSPPEDIRTVARYLCEIGTLVGVLSYVLLQQGEELKNQGLVAFVKQLTHAPAKAIFLVSNLLILACIPCRLMGDRSSEEAILVVAVPGSWFLLMFFAGAVRLTGPFVTMIYSMITGDMLTFGIIYTIVLFGFSQSFFFLYRGFPGVKNSLYSSYPSTWMALFQITLGDYTYTELSFTTYPNLTKTVFALFMVFVPILLLNMLIAMMGNTYAHVIEQSEKEWMKQWAKIVVTLERAVAQSDAHQYLQEYSIGLGPSDDPRYEQRAVMIIKSKSKTRAKQRKGAVANWKRVGKVTINELRKRNMTGEDLRRIMWGRASISTPTKIPIKPQPDPLMQTEGHSIAGGFGEALSSALDVMAFTHDVDLASANGLNLQSNSIKAAAASAASTVVAPNTGNNIGKINQAINPNFVKPNELAMPTPGGVGLFQQAKSAIDTGGNMMGMLHQLSESQVHTEMKGPLKQDFTTATTFQQTPSLPSPNLQAQTPTTIVPPTQTAVPPVIKVYSDPLREIIHLSDSKDLCENEVKIKSLAVEAANLYHVQEVQPNIKPQSRTIAAGVSMVGCLSNLFGVETATGPKVDWGAGEKRQSKLMGIEPSDSEGIGEAPLLGKSARMRRARSATKRNQDAQQNQPTKPMSALSRKTAQLLLIGDTSSSDTAGENGIDNNGFGLSPEDVGLEYANERIEQIQQSMMNIYRGNTPELDDHSDTKCGLALKDMRPLNIEQAIDSNFNGGSALDTITERAVIFQGEGAGIEVQSGNSEHYVRFQNEPHKQKAEKKKSERKRSTRPRPKTARANRVAPMITTEDPNENKRGQSAHQSKHRKLNNANSKKDEIPASPPDPLENWSTAGLVSMNSLLSWENESDDY